MCLMSGDTFQTDKFVELFWGGNGVLVHQRFGKQGFKTFGSGNPSPYPFVPKFIHIVCTTSAQNYWIASELMEETQIKGAFKF